jgi:pyruvate dehydrogenase E2 component (dihydrolipoamide acetyltransferase)
MDEGVFVEWLKRDGEPVQPGDGLFVLESDKATETIDALDAGLLRLGPTGPKPGDRVKVGQVLAHLAAVGEVLPTETRVQKPEVREAVPIPLPVPPAEGTSAAPSRRRAISPRARRVARHMGIDWSALQGSGRNGRIRERDVRTWAATASEGRLIPHMKARLVIAARMVAGVTQAAPVTLTTRADATNLVAWRRQLQAAATSPGAIVPGYTDLIVTLSAAALRQHPLLQAQWRDEGLFVPARIHIAIAVDTEAGLFAPVLRNADRLTVQQIAASSHELISAARTGRLSADQMRDATFTVTNLGMYGVDAFTPIVHLPQSAVLGVGRIVREPAVVGDVVVPRDRLTLSLTFDHRVVDGAPAARFLDTLRQGVEQAPGRDHQE